MTQVSHGTGATANGHGPDFEMPIGHFDGYTVGSVLVVFPSHICLETLDSKLQQRHLVKTRKLRFEDIARVSLGHWVVPSVVTLSIHTTAGEVQEIVMPRRDAEVAVGMIRDAAAARAAA